MKRRFPYGLPKSETFSREHLANERTLLSWARTGMNAIGIGILLYLITGVVRYLPDDSILGPVANLQTRGAEFAVVGIGLVVLGALIETVALVRFVQFRREIQRGELTTSAPVYLLMVLAALLLTVAYIGYVVIS